MTYAFLLYLVVAIAYAHADGQPPKYTNDVKVKYFTDIEIHCDHIDLNVSSQNVKSISWIFPDGSLVDDSTRLDPKLYQLSGIPDANSPNTGQNPMGYTLKAFSISDDVFGYYTCIVLLETPNKGDKVVAIRWGLNVNGADFSELIDEYKENAIIGGIAAAVTLVVIAGGCLTWYFCCSDENVHSTNDDHDLGKEAGGGAKSTIEMHENIGYVGDKEEKRVISEQPTNTSEMDSVKF